MSDPGVTVGELRIEKPPWDRHNEGPFAVWLVVGRRRLLVRGGFTNYYQAHKWVRDEMDVRDGVLA